MPKTKEIKQKLKEKEFEEEHEEKVEDDRIRREKAIKVKKIAKEMEKGNQSKVI